MERIVIRGTSGSGKSTLGALLSEQLGLPVIELDDHWHLPGWQIRPEAEFRARVAELVEGDRWIVVGNYKMVSDLVLARADTALWLDYSMALTLYRVTKRTIRRWLRRELCCNGNREDPFRSFFTRDSIIWWTLTTHRRRHEQCAEFIRSTDHPDVQKLSFRSPRELSQWLTGVKPPLSVQERGGVDDAD